MKFVLTPSGGLDALVVDWESGAFVPDRGYFAKVSDSGIGKDVDQLTEEQFAQAVLDIRRPIVTRHVTTPLPWRATGDGEYPYRAEVNGHVYVIRVNDWPAAWTRPEVEP